MTEVYDIINPQREIGFVPATDTAHEVQVAPGLNQIGGAIRVSHEPRPSDSESPAPAPKRQSGPQPLPSPSSDTRRIPKRISGGQPTQNPAPAMNHHYPNVQPKPADPVPLPAQPTIKRQSGSQTALIPKRQSGPQPLPHVARKTPPILQARHTPPVLHATQPPPEKRDTQILQKPQSKAQSRNVAAPREAYAPRWYQFHIRTLVLVVCLAAGLSYMNFRAPAIVGCQTVFKQEGETKVTSYVTTIRGRGWPLTHSQTVETSDPILAMEAFQKSAPQGFGGIGARNILICLALVLGAGVMCEVLMRRSDASELALQS